MKPTPPARGIAQFVPGLALFGGAARALLRTEFVVAATVFAVLVPSAMAYGDLAGVTPVAGLYVALGAMVMYALFGTSRQLIMGPEATTAIMTAAAVAPLAGGDPVRYAALAALAAILVGLLALLARVARLGFITDFLSKPILVGYIFGTTLIVIGSQLGKMFGIKLESDEFFRQVAEVISRLDETHLLTFVIGVVCVAALFLMRRVSRTLPGPLIVVVAAIVGSTVLDWSAKGVAIVGAVPAGLPRLTIPAFSVQDIFSLLPAALALTILIYADEVLTARVFANRHGQKIDANQEFVAIGFANIGAGFLTGFPAATSGSRTAVADQMGGKSQWVGLIAAALTIIFLLFFTPLLAPLPTVVLGAIIIVASFGLLDLAAFRFLRQVRSVEFWLAVVTALGVLTVGILQGVLVAVMLSLVNVIYHISRPHDALLDDLDASGGTVYRGVTDKETTLTEPGLIVYRFDAPLVFANAAYFTERLEALVANAGPGLNASSWMQNRSATSIRRRRRRWRIWTRTWSGLASSCGSPAPIGPLRDLLQVTGLTARIGQENLHPSVRSAVTAYRARFGAAAR